MFQGRASLFCKETEVSSILTVSTKCVIMKITTIDLSKGDSFKNCTWRKTTKKEEEKIMLVLSKYKQY